MCGAGEDAEYWAELFQAYKDSPDAAFRLACMLHFVRQTLDVTGGREAAIELLNKAIDELFPYSYHYHACRRLYRCAVEGKLRPEHDPTLACLAADPTWAAFRFPDGDPDPDDAD